MQKKQTFLSISLIAALLSGAGCISPPQRESFHSFERTVAPEIDGASGLTRLDPCAEPAPAVKSMLTEPLRAETVVRIALANNRRIQAKYETLDIAAANRLSARLLKNPEAGGAVIFSEDDPDKDIVELEAEIDVLHMILLPKKKAIGMADYRETRMDVARDVRTLAYNARIAFYRLLAGMKKLNLQRDATYAADASSEMAKRLRNAGNIKELDQLNRQAGKERSNLNVMAAELTVTEDRERLNVLMGLDRNYTEWKVSDTKMPPVDRVPSLEEASEQALDNSLQLAMIREQIQIAARKLGIARMKSVIPRLHLGVAAEREGDGTWFTGPRLAVEIPVFDFGQARRPAAKAEIRRLQHEFAATSIEISAAARKAVEQVRTANSRLKLYEEKLLPLRRKITERTQLQYNAMQLGVFRLLETKQQEIAAESRYIDEQLNYRIAQAELQQILEGLIIQTSGRSAAMKSPSAMQTGNDNH
ncbi:MAG: TolC family protein [Verrucomicrobiota bacterium]